jgi:uncharacterized protein involved in exopolysaccharide biosynthesis
MYMAAVNRLMSSVMRFKNDEQTGMLVVTAAYPNPDMAAKIANAYVDILQDIINENSNQVAKKDRIFIDEQLAKRKIEYLKVAKELSKFYGVGRVSNVKSSLDVQVPLKGDDGVYEGDILSILEEKEKELAGKLEQVEVVEDVPQQVYLQYLTLRKELLQQMCSLLAQQVEVTKIKELEKTLSFQIVDSAEPPLQRSKPKRKQMVMFALIGSVFVGMAAAILYEYVKKVRNQQ